MQVGQNVLPSTSASDSVTWLALDIFRQFGSRWQLAPPSVHQTSISPIGRQYWQAVLPCTIASFRLPALAPETLSQSSRW